MRLLFGILLVTVLLNCGCSSFSINESSLRRACKSGVEEYDDGTTSFKCYNHKPGTERIQR